jgi:hypothetical protein
MIITKKQAIDILKSHIAIDEMNEQPHEGLDKVLKWVQKK